MPRHALRFVIAAVAAAVVVSVTPSIAAEAATAKVQLRAPSVWAKTATIKWTKVRGASYYRVCLKGDHSQKCARHTGKLRGLARTERNLRPTAGVDWYYRVAAYSKKGKLLSHAWGSFDLPVRRVTGVTTARHGASSFEVQWNNTLNASKYEVMVGTDPRFDDPKLYTRFAGGTGTATHLSGFTRGETYHVRVRGFNDAKIGAWSPTTTFTLTPTVARVRVATYNLCGEDRCRTTAAMKAILKPWPKRKAQVAKRVIETKAGIVATQESAKTKTNLITALPGFRVGAYKSAKTTFYRPGQYTSLSSGSVTLSAARGKYAVWNIFRHKKTGVDFVFANAHLTSGGAVAQDNQRAQEMRALTAAIHRINPSRLPVIYAGDWNSNSSRKTDEPAEALADLGFVNALDIAASAKNPEHNSAISKGLTIRPNYHHTDSIFVENDIASVIWWRQYVDLNAAGNRYRNPLLTDHHAIAATVDISMR